MQLLIRWMANALGLFVAAQLDLLSYADRLLTLLLAAAVLGVVNALVRPLMIVLSLPAIVLTLGLFVFVVNAIMLWLTDKLVPNFELFGFWRSVGAAIVVSLANWLVNRVTGEHDGGPRET